jgi:hypothetical protein
MLHGEVKQVEIASLFLLMGKGWKLCGTDAAMCVGSAGNLPAVCEFEEIPKSRRDAGATETIASTHWSIPKIESISTVVPLADSYLRGGIIPGAMKSDRAARQDLLRSLWRCVAGSISSERPFLNFVVAQ